MALVGAQFVSAVSPNPVGSLQAFAGASAPAGWLLCDGGQTLITAYPELYSVLGTVYGDNQLWNGTGGAGTTHFRVPDLRGRVPVGKGTHVDVDALGDNEGITSANAANRRPKHQHTVYDPSHAHSLFANAGQSGNAYGYVDGFSNNSSGPINTDGKFTGIKVNPGGVASDTASPQDSPAYLVVNYIIKAVPDAPRSGIAYGSTPPIVTALPANPQFGDQATVLASGQYEPYQYMGATDGWKQLGTSCAPSCGLWLTANVSQTVNTSISWNTTSLWDTDTMFSSGTPTRMTAKTAGVYLVNVTGQATATSFTYLLLTLRVNGSLRNSASYFPINNNEVRFNFSAAYKFAANDYAEIQVGYSGTGFLITGTANNETRTRATMTYLSQGAL